MTERLVMMALLLANWQRAQDVTIKLAHARAAGLDLALAAQGDGREVGEASGGKVKLKIYAGGTQGSEGDMVRKMGVGQLQAASITNVGCTTSWPSRWSSPRRAWSTSATSAHLPQARGRS